MLVADTGNRVVRRLSPASDVTTLSGADVYVAARNGTGTEARFARAAGIDRLANGDLLVADLEAHAIRRVTPAGVVTTFAGELNVGGFADGVGSVAKFNFPIDVAVAPSGHVYVLDHGNHAIRLIDPEGLVTTVAGPQPGPVFNPGTGSGFVDGAGAAARFNLPTALALSPTGEVYVADYANSAIRVLRGDGTVATIRQGAPEPSQPAFRQYPTGMAWAPDGYLVVTEQEVVRRVNLDGSTAVIAGEGQGLYAGLSNLDGIGAAARFMRAAGVAVDGAGVAYVADEVKLRQVTAAGVVTTLGGPDIAAPSSSRRAVRVDADGVGSLASFSEAWGVTRLTDGRLVLAERGRLRIGSQTTGEAPSITIEPADATVDTGTAATITLQASGNPAAEFVLERLVSRTLGFPYVIPAQVWEPVQQPGGGYWTTTPSLSTLRTTVTDNGARFRVGVSNGYGRLLSRELTLTVTGPPQVSAVSGDLTLRLGQSSTFQTTVSGGAPSPTVQWQVSVDGVSGWTALNDSSSYAGTSTATLSVLSAPLSLHGMYLRAVATNTHGSSTSSPVRVVVVAAVFTQQPANAAPEPGGSATFTAIVDALGGTATYQWQAVGESSTWINLTDSATVSGAQTASLTVTNATTTMRLRLVVSANGGSVISTTVTLEPTSVTFTASPVSLTFVARRTTQGFELPAAKSVSIAVTSTAAVTASWSVTSAPAWISTTRTTLGGGWPTGVVAVSVASGYDFGTATSLSGTVTISGTATTGSGSVPVSASVGVTLTIQPESQNALPFGNLDTPATGATGLAGAVAVTGWALDDIGVVRVEIWRDCIENIDRSRGACRATPNNDVEAVYVGDALFVSGARPDVASQFSGYPEADRAGWGLMVLTNMLPHIPTGAAVGGQGTFQLSAYAIDTAGAAALLGRSLVSVDNDNSQLPFGAIDSPISGGVLVANQVFTGWGIGAGNRCIAVFRMYVDGVEVNTSNGLSIKLRPTRPDVDALFPNTCPSEQKGLAFYLLGVAIPGGRHTVSFEATDTLGNTGQFGSRFFDVLAPVTTGPRPSAAEAPDAPAQARAAARVMTAAAIRARIGGVDAPTIDVPRGPDDVYRVTMPVGERLRLELGGPVTSGAQIVDGRMVALPGGSHLDGAGGVFSWEPPLGYFGAFELVFETEAGPIRVLTRIGPVTRTGRFEDARSTRVTIR